MKTPDPYRPLSKASEEAVEWHVRLTSGAATDEDWQAHQDWLAADPVHLEAFDRVQQSWAALDATRDAVLDAFPMTRAKKAPSPSRGLFAGLAHAFAWPVRAPLWQSAMAGAAAVFLIVLSVTLVPGLITPTPEIYATAIGQVRTVTLADGSTAALDTDTEIKVHYRGWERMAELVHGSVLFDVVHDPARPFEVIAGPHEVSVLGTKFEVSWRDQRTVVAVARGIVSVSAMPGATPAEAHRLEKGQRLVYRTPTAAPVSQIVDPDDVGSWERGQLVFDGIPLARVVERMNHYFPDTKLEVGDAAVGNMMFTGVIKIGTPAATARRIAEIMSLHYDKSGSTIRLTPKPNKT